MYDGYFRDYPEDEEVDDELMSKEPDSVIAPKFIEEARRQSLIFERMILEKVAELEGDETAAIMEYIIQVEQQGGFWNDPKSEEVEWDKDGATKIAKRAIETFNDQPLESEDRKVILEEAGLEDSD